MSKMSLEDLRDAFKKAAQLDQDCADNFWEGLSYQDKCNAFHAVVQRIVRGELDERGTYRYVLYEVFGFDVEMYVRGMNCGYLALHNAIVDEDEKTNQCSYPKCQATNGCVGVCSKTAPVHAIDIPQERVDETAKRKHDLVYRLRKRAEIRRQIPDRKSVQEGQPDRIADLLEEAADALEKREWVEQPDLARVGEVGVWGDKREWVGLTDDEIWECFTLDHVDFARAIEAKLKEKNT